MREEKKESHQHHQQQRQKHQQPQPLHQPQHHQQPQPLHHHQQPQPLQQPQHHQQPQPIQQHHSSAEPARYGTFQGVSHQPSGPAKGSNQPSALPGSTAHSSQHYAHGYQAVPGSEVAARTHESQSPLPCCGCGYGWFLFIIGFFLAAIPWYIAACILLCCKIDSREKTGYIACAVAAVLVTIAIIIVVVLV